MTPGPETSQPFSNKGVEAILMIFGDIPFPVKKDNLKLDLKLAF